MVKKLINTIFSIFMAIVCCFPANAQKKYPEAILKNPFPVIGLSWLQGDKKFLYTEENKVIVRDLKSLSVVNTIEPSQYDIKQATYFPSSTDSEKILVRTDDDNIYVIKLPEADKTLLPVNEKIKSRSSEISFSKNGNNIAFGNDNGSVYVVRTFQILNQFQEYLFRSDDSSSVYTLAFSDNGNYLASGNENNKISIWNVNSQKMIDKIEFNSSIEAPVIFSKDNKKIIYAYDKKNIVVQEFSQKPQMFGEENSASRLVIERKKKKDKKVYTTAQKNGLEAIEKEDDYYYEAKNAVVIHVDDTIKNFKLSSSGNYVVVHTQQEQLRFYNVKTGKQYGYLPNFDGSKIIDFSLNNADVKVLVSHENGTVFLYNVNDYLLRPNDKSPELSKLGNGGGRYRVGDQIDARLNYVYHESPYPLGIEVDFGYMAAKMKWKPLYVGVFGEFDFAFPNEEFPYSYYYGNGGKFQNPYLIGAGLIFPVGIHIVPFQRTDIYFRTQLELGASAHALWNGSFGDNFLTSDCGGSFNAGCTFGAGFKDFLLNVSFKYDSCIGFVFATGLGYNRKLFQGKN